MSMSAGDLCLEIVRLAKSAGLPTDVLPADHMTPGAESLWIEPWGHDGYFALRYCERGSISEVVIGQADEVIFESLRQAAFSLASRRELENRRLGEDSRRQLFEIEEDLMARIRPEWSERVRQQNALTLEQHPFRDVGA